MQSILDLGDTAVLQVQGDEAADFLQNQLSNDVQAAGESQCQLNAYCNPQGRVVALLRLARRREGFYLLLPRDLSQAALRRLQMFILRAKVEITADENLAVCGLINFDADFDAADFARVSVDGARRQLLIGDRGRLEEFAHMNKIKPARDDNAWRMADILAGQPQIYAATTAQWIPQMLNLDLIGGVSFSKGCYPGQEIVARLKYRGKVKQRMLIGRAVAAEKVRPGDAVYADAYAERPVGRIIDAATAPAGGAAEYTFTAVAPVNYLTGGALFLAGGRAPIERIAAPYDADLRASVTHAAARAAANKS